MNKIIVGLGNPGVKYRYTRHNVGFIVVDQLAVLASKKRWKEAAKFDGAKICEIDGTLLVKPQTFMNNSGVAVAKIAEYYDLKPEQICVVHDDMDLEFLQVKNQQGAGSAGHHGVEDIISKLGSKEFWRTRIGVGHPANTKVDPSDWVLTNFSAAELDKVKSIADQFKPWS